jgi:hypothetical protein
MNAQKFQLRYSPVEDRILIIVTDDADQDEVFGLTRRLVKRLVPGLEKVLRKAGHLVQPPVADTVNPAPAPTPAEVTALSAQQKPAAPAGAGSSTEPEPPAPVSTPSHLVTRLRVIEKGKGRHMLQLTDGAKSLSIPLTDEQLAQFPHGIVTVLGNINWNLSAVPGNDDDEVATAESGAAALDISADSPSKYRH